MRSGPIDTSSEAEEEVIPFAVMLTINKVSRTSRIAGNKGTHGLAWVVAMAPYGRLLMDDHRMVQPTLRATETNRGKAKKIGGYTYPHP